VTFRARYFFAAPNQLLELVAASAAPVIVDRHGFSLAKLRVRVKRRVSRRAAASSWDHRDASRLTIRESI
jgi:hypothetical protein